MSYDTHPAAELFPRMSDADLQRLAADIKANGLLVPAMLYQGKLLDGRHRQLACARVGVELRTTVYEGDDPFGYVVSRNLHRRHLTTSQQAMVGARLCVHYEAAARERQGKRTDLGADLPEGDGRRARDDAAAVVGVSSRTVEHGRRVLRDGVPELAEAVERGDLAVSRASEVSQLPPEDQRAELAEPKRGAPKALQSSESNEWYTPAEVIACAREVLGTIDLDPASCELANETVKADAYHTEETDGLACTWAGKVWLNPPYGRDADGRSNQGVWADKLIAEYVCGRVTAAILLVSAVPDRQWFHGLWSYPVCFVYKRIRFYCDNPAQQARPTHPNVLVYLGPDAEAFDRVMHGKVGHVVLPR